METIQRYGGLLDLIDILEGLHERQAKEDD